MCIRDSRTDTFIVRDAQGKAVTSFLESHAYPNASLGRFLLQLAHEFLIMVAIDRLANP